MLHFIKKIRAFWEKRHSNEMQRNAITFSICLLIATALWFLNTLNKEYTLNLSFPVKYTNLPKDKSLISELPQEITLELKGHGFSLLRYQIIHSFLPIVFNVGHYNNGVINRKNILDYTVQLADNKERISSQLNSDLQLVNITPTNIRFQFSPLGSKWVSIIPQLKYTLAKQHVLKDSISITPEQILINGPTSQLDTIQRIYTEPIAFKELSKTLSQSLDLKPIPGISFHEQKVKLHIAIERSTEGKKNIPLVVKNLPDSLRLQLFPSHVEVTYEVGLSRYDQVRNENFKLYVDYQQIGHSSVTLPVQIEKRPSFIQNLTLSPTKVEYLIEKK